MSKKDNISVTKEVVTLIVGFLHDLGTSASSRMAEYLEEIKDNPSAICKRESLLETMRDNYWEAKIEVSDHHVPRKYVVIRETKEELIKAIRKLK